MSAGATKDLSSKTARAMDLSTRSNRIFSQEDSHVALARHLVWVRWDDTSLRFKGIAMSFQEFKKRPCVRFPGHAEGVSEAIHGGEIPMWSLGDRDVPFFAAGNHPSDLFARGKLGVSHAHLVFCCWGCWDAQPLSYRTCRG